MATVRIDAHHATNASAEDELKEALQALAKEKRAHADAQKMLAEAEKKNSKLAAGLKTAQEELVNMAELRRKEEAMRAEREEQAMKQRALSTANLRSLAI